MLMNIGFCEIAVFLFIGIHSTMSTQAMDIVALFTHENCNIKEEMLHGESSKMATLEKATMQFFMENYRPTLHELGFREYNICSESEALDQLLDVFRDKDTLALVVPGLQLSLCDSMATLAEEYHRTVLSYDCIGDIRGDHSQHTYHKAMFSHSHKRDASLIRSIPTSAVIAHVLANTLKHFRYKRFALYFTGDHPCWDSAHSVLTSLSTEGFQLMHFIQETVLHANSTLDILRQLTPNTKGRSTLYY